MNHILLFWWFFSAYDMSTSCRAFLCVVGQVIVLAMGYTGPELACFYVFLWFFIFDGLCIDLGTLARDA